MWLIPREIDNFRLLLLESVGRAMCVAQNFEHNCKYVLMIVEMGRHAQDTSYTKSSEMWSHSERLYKRALARSIMDASEKFQISPKELAILSRAKDSRNYLAHNAALHFAVLPSLEMTALLKEYCEHVQELAAGDNLVATWSFSIQEKQATPNRSTMTYTQDIGAWILSPIENVLTAEITAQTSLCVK